MNIQLFNIICYFDFFMNFFDAFVKNFKESYKGGPTSRLSICSIDYLVNPMPIPYCPETS